MFSTDVLTLRHVAHVGPHGCTIVIVNPHKISKDVKSHCTHQGKWTNKQSQWCGVTSPRALVGDLKGGNREVAIFSLNEYPRLVGTLRRARLGYFVATRLRHRGGGFRDPAPQTAPQVRHDLAPWTAP